MELYKDPHFVNTYDDDFDNTYATYLFEVPERWKSDFEKISEGKIMETSDEYKNYIREFWPLLNEKGWFNKAFGIVGEKEN